MNKTLYILGALVIAGFALLGIMEMLNAQPPYLTRVSDVKSAGRPLRFTGEIVHEKTRYDSDANLLHLVLKDVAGETIGMRYEGVEPRNLSKARKALVYGSFVGNELVADQLKLDDSLDPAKK